MSEKPRFYTTQQVGDLVCAPAETVRYWAHIGKGPKSFKVGRRRLYAAEDVEAWLADARESGKAT